MIRSVREALSAMRRAPLLIAISVVAVSLSLFVVGIFGLAAWNVRTALDRIEERVEVVAYLRDEVTPAERQRFEAELGAMPEVARLVFISRTQALATAMQDLPEFQNVFGDLDENPLPASYEIQLRPGYRTPDATGRLAQIIGAYPFVEDVSFGREWVEKIVSLERIAAGTTAVLGGAFAAVAGIIIATAVRIAVFARREEIEIMRLVGATNGFIRAPFLVEGFLAGLLGGLVAVALTFVAYRVVNASLLALDWIPPVWLVGAVAAGALYGLLASAFAVRRHLRAI